MVWTVSITQEIGAARAVLWEGKTRVGEGVPKPGTSVGRYRLQNRLGRGTMGEVWRAYDSRLKRSVAIKLLDPQQNSPTELERFLQEARALGRLNHPNVVTVHDVGEWPANGSTQPFIVMELLEGRTLADELAERGPLPVDEVRAAGIAIASGLRATHEAGVVHRDLSPDNLMRASDGTLKLVDFGIADIGRRARLTRPGILLGSVNYVAPERVRGDHADARCDLYSLGCVLYELLCGRPPFDGDLVTIAFAHVFNDVVPPNSARPDLPDDLDGVVLALLAKEPAARPPTAASVVTALRDGVALPAPTAALREPAAGAGRHRGRFTRRRATGLAAAVAVVLLVLGLSSWIAPDVQPPAKAATPSVAPAPPDNVRPSPGTTPTPTLQGQSRVRHPVTMQPRPGTTTTPRQLPQPVPTATVTSVVTVSPTSEPTAEPKKSKKPKKPKKDKG
jgi:hypothetical protein